MLVLILWELFAGPGVFVALGLFVVRGSSEMRRQIGWQSFVAGSKLIAGSNAKHTHATPKNIRERGKVFVKSGKGHAASHILSSSSRLIQIDKTTTRRFSGRNFLENPSSKPNQPKTNVSFCFICFLFVGPLPPRRDFTGLEWDRGR
ncbi:hypothetical protein B0H67DRAFT_233467 [Lasiosphaeris hirsuta]|uniref:Uncharacterized protein n=1 Tax=Lasiosphaeris hirsuta TaxID=260670 RepID=A0AA40DTM7_9PEZI|nr:hypothetical protein B0H67DRAFT_233467 [Lasiosphaeris hirsuta]